MKPKRLRENIIVAGKAADGFPDGEENRLAATVADRGKPPEKRRAAVKRLRQVRFARATGEAIQ
jgi:hypothetical protein